MKELRIYKDTVSHIAIHDKKLYQTLTLDGWKDYNFYAELNKSYLWGLYKKHLPAGYYTERQWKNPHWKNWYTIRETLDSPKLMSIAGKLYLRPHIDIFSGGKLITTKYFHTAHLAKSYCDKHFPNVDIII